MGGPLEYLTCKLHGDGHFHRPITTSVFDMYKIGPGPSSSHTIGPMKAARDFLQHLSLLASDGSSIPLDDNYKLEIHLFGSLSATGRGHGTHTAIVAGLLGWIPKTCDANALIHLLDDNKKFHLLPLEQGDKSANANKVATPTATGKECDTQLCSKSELLPTQQTQIAEEATPRTLAPSEQYFPLSQLSVNGESFVWHSGEESEQFPHPNTMQFRLIAMSNDECVIEGEYYSTGGGFIQRKGFPPEDERKTTPPYPYWSWTSLREQLSTNKLDLAELMLANEMALTGVTREEIEEKLDEIIGAMEAAVLRGLNTEGVLPGAIRLQRKAQALYRTSKGDTNFLPFLNAYCMAASEENAAGNRVVTAPTSGASGVLPGLIHFMRHHLFYDRGIIRNAFLAGTAVGFIIKRNASISGAEMGCMGEVGTASAMGAAMLAHAAGRPLLEIEASAEIAMEHHLGLTCDPIGGYVQVPCIQRNPMGGVKAYNAFLLAKSGAGSQVISLDRVVAAMRDTGMDMNAKYRETSAGGLALTVGMTEC